jgi:hypothetical protein
MPQAVTKPSRYTRMGIFKRGSTTKRADRAHDEHVSERMRAVLNKKVDREDAETVETRIRNLNYGSSRK